MPMSLDAKPESPPLPVVDTARPETATPGCATSTLILALGESGLGGCGGGGGGGGGGSGGGGGGMVLAMEEDVVVVTVMVVVEEVVVAMVWI
jgi:hypothetical protein